MLEILYKNPLASFAYIGANTITNNYLEPKAFTKRHRVYEYVMDEFVSTNKFERYISKMNSAVLLFNKQNEKNTISKL